MANSYNFIKYNRVIFEKYFINNKCYDFISDYDELIKEKEKLKNSKDKNKENKIRNIDIYFKKSKANYVLYKLYQKFKSTQQKND